MTTLNQNGHNWANSNNIGKQLLIKAGWSVGDGLGKNKQGTKEHIKVSIKNEKDGIGLKSVKRENNLGVMQILQFDNLLKSMNANRLDNSNNEDAVEVGLSRPRYGRRVPKEYFKPIEKSEWDQILCRSDSSNKIQNNQTQSVSKVSKPNEVKGSLFTSKYTIYEYFSLKMTNKEEEDNSKFLANKINFIHTISDNKNATTKINESVENIDLNYVDLIDEKYLEQEEYNSQKKKKKSKSKNSIVEIDEDKKNLKKNTDDDDLKNLTLEDMEKNKKRISNEIDSNLKEKSVENFKNECDIKKSSDNEKPLKESKISQRNNEIQIEDSNEDKISKRKRKSKKTDKIETVAESSLDIGTSEIADNGSIPRKKRKMSTSPESEKNFNSKKKERKSKIDLSINSQIEIQSVEITTSKNESKDQNQNTIDLLTENRESNVPQPQKQTKSVTLSNRVSVLIEELPQTDIHEKEVVPLTFKGPYTAVEDPWKTSNIHTIPGYKYY